jgi:hypothetical protein
MKTASGLINFEMNGLRTQPLLGPRQQNSSLSFAFGCTLGENILPARNNRGTRVTPRGGAFFEFTAAGTPANQNKTVQKL